MKANIKTIKELAKKNYGVNALLSKGTTNSKTAKNKEISYILYMSPARQNFKSINLCPKASAGCLLACLYTAGRGKFSNVQQARTNKADYYVGDRSNFLIQLSFEINKAIKNAKGAKVFFRLNGTTDIDLIGQLINRDLLNLETLPKNVHFYDYTAIIGKCLKYKNTPNYTLTFSRKEDNYNDYKIAIKEGINTAVVFNGKLPVLFSGQVVLDGDKSDLVMIGQKNICLGLIAKGEAKNDTSGFVVNKNFNLTTKI